MTVGPALSLSGVHHAYGPHQVLSGVDLSVAPGEIVGLLGANASGKTTLLRIATGLLRPDAGLLRCRARGSPGGIMSLFERGPADRHQTPLDAVRTVHGYLHRTRGKLGAELVDPVAALDQAGVPETFRHRPFHSLSHGTRQRSRLACVLVARSSVLLLDEPHSGLDPLTLSSLAGVLRDRAREGTAIIVSSHLTDEIERTCSRAVLLEGGRIVADVEVNPTPTQARFAVRPVERALRVVGRLGMPASTDAAGDLLVDVPAERVAAIVGRLVSEGVEVDRCGPWVGTLVERIEQARRTSP